MIKKTLNIYKKHEEIINYIISGGVTTVVSLITYYLCIYTFLSPDNAFELQVANIISWVAGLIIAYITNRLFVFKSKSKKKQRLKEITKFVSSRITTLLVDMLIMFLTVTLLHLNDKIMKIISNVVVIVLNYVLSKIFVFIKDKN